MATDNIIDPSAVTALTEIFADPSLPVRTVLTGPDGKRVNALREAHDFVSTHRLAAGAASSDAHAAALLAEFGEISSELATSLRWHTILAPLLTALPSSRARNGLLGDIHRGALVTWAPTVRSWNWVGGTEPSADAPLQHAHGEIEIDEHPALFDAIILWETKTSALIVIPTYRQHLSWSPSVGDERRWTVTLSDAVFHLDDVIPLAKAPDLPVPGLAVTPENRERRTAGSASPVTIDVATLQHEIDSGRDVVVLEVGRDAVAGGERIPGAHPTGLGQHFAGRAGDRTGSFPLPELSDLQRDVRSWGVNPDSLVVVYTAENAIFAAKAWWILRWAGVPDVRFLDGGLAAWKAAGATVTTQLPPLGHGTFELSPGALTELDAQGAAETAQNGVLIDSRGGDSFAAGHIPGAVRLPAADVLDADGKFLSDDVLRAQFASAGLQLDGETRAVGAYCPIAAAAALSVLALAKVGITADLYAGGYSAWLSDPERAVATA